MTAVATVAATATAEAIAIEEPEKTPLVASVDSLADELLLRPAEELTPSEEIVVIDLSSIPPAIEEDDLEIVEDDELASEAALIEEALAASEEDEAPVSSERPRAMHSLEAAMAPMELDPISDRPTARITLPPESGPQLASGDLAPAPLPTFDDLALAADEGAAESAPEITISSEPAEIAWAESEEPLELIELGPADEVDVDEAPLAIEIAAEPEPEPEPELVLSVPAEPPTLNRSVAELNDPFEDEAEPEAEPAPARTEPLSLQELADPFEEEEEESPAEIEAVEPEAAEEPAELSLAPAEAVSEVRVLSEPAPASEASAPLEIEPLSEAERDLEVAAAEPVEEVSEAKSGLDLTADVVRRPDATSVEVATFVERAEGFAPKSFGELLDASLDL